MPDTKSAASARSDRPGTYVAGDVYTAGGDFIGGDKYEIHLPQSRSERRDQRNQQVLLAKVRSFWIEGVLEKSLHRAVQLEIAKDSRPDLVGHPWDAVVELPGGQAQSLPAETQPADLFDQSGRALLILGAPGSGKTHTLLELVRDLIERARHDPLQPIPVVLNLSAWGARGQTFAGWVVDELSTRYQVPHRTGRRWLENYHLSLMLDGLDEVDRDRPYHPGEVDAEPGHLAFCAQLHHRRWRNRYPGRPAD